MIVVVTHLESVAFVMTRVKPDEKKQTNVSDSANAKGGSGGGENGESAQDKATYMQRQERE